MGLVFGLGHLDLIRSTFLVLSGYWIGFNPCSCNYLAHVFFIKCVYSKQSSPTFYWLNWVNYYCNKFHSFPPLNTLYFHPSYWSQICFYMFAKFWLPPNSNQEPFFSLEYNKNDNAFLVIGPWSYLFLPPPPMYTSFLRPPICRFKLK